MWVDYQGAITLPLLSWQGIRKEREEYTGEGQSALQASLNPQIRSVSDMQGESETEATVTINVTGNRTFFLDFVRPATLTHS